MPDRPEGSDVAFRHVPVMVDEIVEVFGTVPPGTVLDATVGGGGHAAALLDAHPHLSVLGLDRDPDAVVAARRRLEASHPGRVAIVRARFDQLSSAMTDHGCSSLSGALFDLGVSSPQLDRADRGFSYRADGPIDMRMDPDHGAPASALVNDADVATLAEVIRRGSDERYARRIAAAIVAARPIRTTGELAEVVKAAIPAPARRRGGHPATRTFQALRIAVNDELDILRPALEDAIAALTPGGRLAVLSYHSGEDRIVKATLRDAETGGCTCPPGLPCGCGARPTVRLVWRGSHTPGAGEQATNPRASSARLRVAERLEEAA